VNKHLLIDDKRGELEVTPCLTALVKRVIELHDTGLRACHCAEEFTLQRIHPIGHQDKLAYECSWLADPCCDPTDSKILTSFVTDVDMMF
jgi:hypothetical protein